MTSDPVALQKGWGNDSTKLKGKVGGRPVVWNKGTKKRDLENSCGEKAVRKKFIGGKIP